MAMEIHIEAVQTVSPFKVTEPRQVHRVSVADPVPPGVFQRCLNIVFYYNQVADEDSGWLAAGWIKESLARAQAEQPALSGRLRRGEDGRGDLEIVTNDSGVRLVEAKIPVTMAEFLDVKEGDKDAGTQLVFWKDIDEQNPQYSPLLYVQVTNFRCGGYSVGISCSLLLADLLFKNKFLKQWAEIHNDLVSKTEAVARVPTFYFPNLKKTNTSPASFFPSSQSKNGGQTMVFTSKTVYPAKEVAMVCIEEAELKTGRKIYGEFCLFSRESTQVIKVESVRNEVMVQKHWRLSSEVEDSSWDDLGGNEVAFSEGNKPAHASYWFGTTYPGGEGIVMAFPSPNESTTEMNIILAFPQ
ncbi:putative transferase [Tripterygium wilfordii]|uniref:Putative transferase n=1 Tax=Tripterygium wilfordii TaxID=458696 RepID=A0A7J7CMH9_TRIWF|nr:shikimate O-hydroxycinnamoyltransferase [Tripterygium wilfordii]KAF5735126.1 putative transferase [Tripterygium wilfordii]